jgi:dihydrofolate reductase
LIFIGFSMQTSIIVAISENGAIGVKGNLLCHLSADLRHFKSLTMGHPIIMGRKTFDSLPNGALPGRQNVVVTRNLSFTAPCVTVCHSVEEALEVTASAPQRFIIGGAQLYEAAFPLIDTLYLTRIHASFPDADTFFPEFSIADWDVVSREDFPADERNPFPYSFLHLQRK